jgi:hypothetical protein
MLNNLGITAISSEPLSYYEEEQERYEYFNSSHPFHSFFRDSHYHEEPDNTADL